MAELDRRRLLAATSAGFATLALWGCGGKGSSGTPTPSPTPVPTPSPTPTPTPLGYGPLVPDSLGLLDLPAGFSYRVLSSRGDAMIDGGRVPDNADGMGCFALPGGKIALVRNHELVPGADSGGASGLAYDRTPAGTILPGGTTTIILDAATLEVERQFRSLSGTIRNCAGGITPWGTWLTCEEDTTRVGANTMLDHGWVFEVPANATGPVNPVPLTAMGRFNHEAAAVDPNTGYVYMTEDRDDSLLYRFIPTQAANLAGGGRLQAMAMATGTLTDTRNRSGTNVIVGQWSDIRWIDLDNPQSPTDDLRVRGLALGALRFARGEGIYFGLGELFFTSTSGGAAGMGQVFRISPSVTGGRLQLFFESSAASQYSFGDNIVVAPDGQLIVCEDQGTSPVDNFLRGLNQTGQVYPLARLRIQTETAGACFSPDGRHMFLNIYSPTKTVAITGPWAHLRP